MATIRFNAEVYSDAAYVEGVYRRDAVMERALHKHCKQYFDENYRGVFFAGDEQKQEIFQDAFIKLWENIMARKIYVEDGELRGKEGKPFGSKLTTYFMGIAKLKNKEWVRDHKPGPSANEEEKRWKEEDAEIFRDLLYDDGQETMLEIIADCLANMSERCYQILTLFYYEEKGLDDILVELPTYGSKDALKTEKYKCMKKLKQSAQDIYHRYLNA